MKKNLLIFAIAVCVFCGTGLSSYAGEVQKAQVKSEVKFNHPMLPDENHFDKNPRGSFMPPENMLPHEFQERGEHPQFHNGKHKPVMHEDMELKKAEIEHRLKLTDEQKKQIELNKQKDIENIKPIMQSIKIKSDEFRKIDENKSLTPDEKMKKKHQLRMEIKSLKMHADNCRKENMKNFETLLTDKQKKEFQKIKSEQKKEMEKRKSEHKKMMEKKHKEMEKKYNEHQKKRVKYGLPVQPKPEFIGK